jgi:hypothetical protein
MKRLINLLTGTLMVGLLAPTTAIAQSADYPSWYFREAANSLRYFGLTNQGNHLQLDMRSIQPTARGMRFTYYLSGRPVEAITPCRGYFWYVDGMTRPIPATSNAARGMVNMVCSFR